MKTINRTLLIVVPKTPFLDWANSFDKDTSGFIPATEHHSTYLIPEKYDESNYKTYLKMHFTIILEEELSAQINDPELLPETLKKTSGSGLQI